MFLFFRMHLLVVLAEYTVCLVFIFAAQIVRNFLPGITTFSSSFFLFTFISPSRSVLEELICQSAQHGPDNLRRQQHTIAKIRKQHLPV